MTRTAPAPEKFNFVYTNATRQNVRILYTMSEVIVLSDSNESDSSTGDNRPKETEEGNVKLILNDSLSSEYDFPEVQIHHAFNTNKQTSEIPDKNKELSSDDDDTPILRKSTKMYSPRKSVHNMSDSDDSQNHSNEDVRNLAETQSKAKAPPKKSKEKLMEERVKKREQQAREKALRAINAKKAKDLKPGECMKFMEVVLDKGIENFAFNDAITMALRDANLQYCINTQLIPNSITWKRSVEDSYVDETNQVRTVVNVENIDQTIVVWYWNEAVIKVVDGTFCTSVTSIKSLIPDCNMTLVIFGMKDYFTHKKQEKNGASKNKGRKGSDKSKEEFKNSPDISKRELEMCLAEVQITAKCSNRLVNDPQELALMICQYTKAIAEIPYKLEKNKNLQNKFDWYVMGDNRNTVRVDKDGNGLKRLWQQQLCQFNLSSLEIAEAICSVYPSPTSLIEAYMNCTPDEGMNLLKDIPIRRAAGPLTAVRKVGIELSKKVYTMFTSEDGEAMLR